MLNTVFRIITMYLFAIESETNLKFVFSVISFLITLVKIWDVAPFYNYKTLRIRIIFMGIQLSASVVNFITCIISEEVFFSQIYLIFVVSFLTCKLLCKYLDDKVFGEPNQIFLDISKIKAQEDWFLNYLGLCHILEEGVTFNLEKKSKSFEEIQYLGLMSAHAKTCEDKVCLCKFYNGEHSQKLVVDSKEFSFQILNFNYKIRKDFFEALLKAKLPKNWVRILYAQLIMETRPNKYLIAYSIMSQIKTFRIPLLERYLTKRLNEKITDILRTEITEDRIDVANFIKYERRMKKLQFSIIENCKKTFKFWDHYLQPVPKMETLISYTREINITTTKVNKHWFKLKKINSYYSNDQSLTLALYFSLVTNYPKKAEALFAEWTKVSNNLYAELTKESRLNNKNILDPNNIFIRISMAKNTLGNIIYVSENVQNFYGWKAKDLIGRNLGIMTPRFMRNLHQKFLEDHIEEGSSHRLNQSLFLYGEDNEGYSVPQRLYISPQPDSNFEFSYMGIMRPLGHHADKIIVLEDGRIGGLTRSLAKSLNIDVKTLEKKYIYQYFPSFAKYNEMINLHYFLRFLGVKTPEWLANTSSIVDLDSIRNNLPYPFNKYPEKARYMAMPTSMDDFYNMTKAVRNIVEKGVEMHLSRHIDRHFLKFNVICSVEVLKDGTIIKYLYLEKLITPNIFSIDEKSESLDSENMVEYDDKTGSENLEDDLIDTPLYGISTQNIQTRGKINSYVDINRAGPRKTLYMPSFVNPKYLQSGITVSKNSRKTLTIKSKKYTIIKGEVYKNQSSDGHDEEQNNGKKNHKKVNTLTKYLTNNKY